MTVIWKKREKLLSLVEMNSNISDCTSHRLSIFIHSFRAKNAMHYQSTMCLDMTPQNCLYLPSANVT